HKSHDPAHDLAFLKRDMDRMRPYTICFPGSVPGRVRVERGHDRVMFCDFDALFEQWAHECRFHNIGRADGLRAKPKNTIIASWPMQLKERLRRKQNFKLCGRPVIPVLS
ncbi:hypothetical protein LTR39_005406, partial [Cryomyces antarcticus]